MREENLAFVCNTGLLTHGLPSTPTGDFLMNLFSRLDESGVSYCVLRGYKGLPDVISHDLDLLVHREHLALYAQILNEVSLSQGWRLVRALSRFGFHSWYLVREQDDAFIPLLVDVWTQIQWKATVYAESEVVLGTRKRYNNTWVASSGSEAAVSLLKEYLQSGRVKDKGEGKAKERIALLARKGSDTFLATLEPRLGPTLSQFALDCAKESDWSKLEREVRTMRKRLITRALLRRPVGQIWDWCRFLWGHFSDKVLHPSGLFVCLIGPDGSGKTTVSRGLQRDPKGIFNAVRYYHGHWGLLPELKTYYRSVARLFGKEKKEAVRSEGVFHNQEVIQYSLGRALLYVLYYSVEYVLGYFVILRAKGQGELVLLDRYFYDYMIQSTYSRVPRWLLRLIELVLPRPDVLIWLRNQPEVIHRRKAELSVTQIREQATVCGRIIERHPKRACVVWTDDDPEITLNVVKTKIFECMASRVSTG